jgi:hypothetical protein
MNDTTKMKYCFYITIVAAAVLFLGSLAPLLASEEKACNKCQELRRIRMILESQFNVVCDERRCVGSSSSSNGSEMP